MGANHKGGNSMVGITIKQRRAMLTEEVKKARQEFFNAKRLVEHELKQNHPELKWYEELEEVEKDPRYQVANARLMALCDAANIMGAEIF